MGLTSDSGPSRPTLQQTRMSGPGREAAVDTRSRSATIRVTGFNRPVWNRNLVARPVGGKTVLIFRVRNLRQLYSLTGEQMFEIRYEPPRIFVTRRRTGETHVFLVGANGALIHDGTRFDEGEARQAAIAYLVSARAA